MHETNAEGPAKNKETMSLKDATQPQEEKMLQSEKTETERSEVDLESKIDAEPSSLI